MIKQILERTTGPLTTSQFHELMDLTTTDILVNGIGFGRLTSLGNVLQVAEISFRILERCRAA